MRIIPSLISQIKPNWFDWNVRFSSKRTFQDFCNTSQPSGYQYKARIPSQEDGIAKIFSRNKNGRKFVSTTLRQTAKEVD
jgi:hypothetical protein